MNIVKYSIEDLKPAEYNPRKELKPGDSEYEKLKNSLEHFGYVEPIILNKRTGNIIGGHQRLNVMKDLGYNEVDVVLVDLDDKDEKALNVALNKISGEWDNEKLETLLKELKDEDYNLELTGFDDIDLSSMLDYNDIVLDEEGIDGFLRDRTPEEEEKANKKYIRTPKYKIEVQDEELEAFESIVKQYKDANGTLYNFFAEVIRRWDVEV